MANRRKAVLFSSIVSCALLLFLAACASRQPERVSQEAAAQMKAQMSAAQAGNGFVCTVEGDIGACTCKWGISPRSPYSCGGMESLCKKLGGQVECGDVWCGCGFVLY
jgi:hypothetical protein